MLSVFLAAITASWSVSRLGRCKRIGVSIGVCGVSAKTVFGARRFELISLCMD